MGSTGSAGTAAVRALLAALLFGAAAPLCKPLLERLTPAQLAGLLYLGAALATGPLAAARSAQAGLVPRGRDTVLRLGGMVVAGGIAGPLLLLAALRRGDASSVSLLLNLELAATAVLGALLFREHLGRAGWLGVAGAVCAGALLGGAGGWPGLGVAALAAGACLCWGLDNQLAAGLDRMSPLGVAFWKGLVAGATNLAIGLALAPFVATAPNVALALAVGALGYGASVALLVSAMHELGATRAGAIFASAPFLGAAIAIAWLGEPAAPRLFFAGALLAASAALLLRARHDHAHRHPELEHTHAHTHDDGHHLHAHPGLAPGTRHTHWHRHETLEHAHPHAADLHHRHAHDTAPGSG
jgi:drug/metabolite transporter (DMT)-like permease